MKAYKVEVLVLDFENYGQAQIELMLGDVRGISCPVQSTAEADIGAWADEHPLNHRGTSKAEYQRLFAAPVIAAPVEVERDAARYKWLRESSVGQWTHPIVVEQMRDKMFDRIAYIGPLSGGALDDAIDAAIATGDKHE